MVTNRRQNLITGPIIHGMIFPLLLDLFVSFYQATCFPIYGVTKVRQCDYMVLDRQHVAYLNRIAKFHGTYCAHRAGLTACICEFVSRVEQYFCSIKHAHKVLGAPRHYLDFLEYGDADNYEKKLESFRVALGEK